MTNAVLTINFGGYDNIHEPATVNPDWDYICLTDAGRNVHNYTGAWDIRYIPRLFSDPARDARYWVCRFYLFPYDWVVKIDANMVLKIDPAELLQYAVSGIAAHPHLVRDCIYEEAGAIIKYNLDEPDVVQKQVNRYRAAGYPSHYGLVETGVMVLQKTPTVRDFCDRWWREIMDGSKRNQMSFDYVRWQMGLEVGYLPGNVQDGKFVEIRPHSNEQ